MKRAGHVACMGRGVYSGWCGNLRKETTWETQAWMGK